MPTTNISERDGPRRSGRVGRRCSDGGPRPSRAARLRQFMLLVIGVYLFSNLALWAQATDSQSGEATVTTESQRDNVNSTRIVESHTQSGDRTLDKQSVQ